LRATTAAITAIWFSPLCLGIFRPILNRLPYGIGIINKETTMTDTTRPTRIEINCETGIETVIELTDAEIAEMEAAAAQAEARASCKRKQQRLQQQSR
jgi:hypothetical protein